MLICYGFDIALDLAQPSTILAMMDLHSDVRDRIAKFAQDWEHHLRFYTEKNNFRVRSDLAVLCRQRNAELIF